MSLFLMRYCSWSVKSASIDRLIDCWCLWMWHLWKILRLQYYFNFGMVLIYFDDVLMQPTNHLDTATVDALCSSLASYEVCVRSNCVFSCDLLEINTNKYCARNIYISHLFESLIINDCYYFLVMIRVFAPFFFCWGLWSMVCVMWSMVYVMWSMVCVMWSMVYAMWSMVYVMWSMVYVMWSMVCTKQQGAIVAVSHDEEFVNRLVNNDSHASQKTPSSSGSASFSSSSGSSSRQSSSRPLGELWVLSKQKFQRYEGSFSSYKKLIQKKVDNGESMDI